MNLCKLSNEEQEEIENDKKLWLDAHNLYRNNTRQVINQYLSQLGCEMREADMRRRLNIIVKNSKKL